MANQSQQQIPINPGQVIQAFKVMRQNIGQSSLVADANNYLHRCENNPQFSFVLLDIFINSDQLMLRKQVLGLLKNIVRRNWTAKRRTVDQCYINEANKEKIKNTVLQVYKTYWKSYYSLFNQIFEQISKQDFPHNYTNLYDFIYSVLNTIASYNLDQILNSEELLPYLSTTKKVLKNYGKRRILHNKQKYQKYFEPLLRFSGSIFQKIGMAITNLTSNVEQSNPKMVSNFFECSRKIDKIIIYGIQCAPQQLQGNQLIVGVTNMMYQKMVFLANLKIKNYQAEIQQNLLAIVQGLSKLQSQYPFIFTQFLKGYLQCILNILFNMNFQNSRLINQIIKANKRPLLTYSYYMPPQQFQQSIYCLKGNSSIYIQDQINCYNAFTQVYTIQNINYIIQKCISELLVTFHRQNEDDQIIFEDVGSTNDQINQEDYTPFDLLIQFIKTFFQKFKQQSKLFIKKVMEHLKNNSQSSQKSYLLVAMHEIVLMLPKIYDSNSIELPLVYELMEKSYIIQDYKIFARYIRSYQQYFPQQILHKSFSILINILSAQNIPHQIVYQCSVCIRKLLEDDQIDYTINDMGPCFSNIFRLLFIYKQNPNHLWNLLNLLNQLINNLTKEIIIANIPKFMQNISQMLSMGDNTTVTLEAITNMLQNIIDILSNEKNENFYELCFHSNQLCIKHIQSAFMVFRQSEQGLGNSCLMRLWLSVMKNHQIQHSTPQFNQKLSIMYQTLESQALDEQPIILCEIFEQYLLSKIFQPNLQQISSIIRRIRGQKSIQHQQRTLIAIYSIYYTYSTINNAYIPQILTMLMSDLKAITQRISPIQNSLRTQLLMIIGHHINTFGAENIFSIFVNMCPNSYVQWFWPILWSLQFMNHRYARKIFALALLNSLNGFNDEQLKMPIEGHFPIISITKFLINSLESLEYQQAIKSYNNALLMILHTEQTISSKQKSLNRINNRKYILHINKEWSQINLQNYFKQKIGSLWNRWDWGPDDLQQHFTNTQIQKILSILN